jgi:hypothetical protein
MVLCCGNGKLGAPAPATVVDADTVAEAAEVPLKGKGGSWNGAATDDVEELEAARAV